MIANIDELFKKEKIPLILFVFGEEEFLIDEALQKIIRKVTNYQDIEFDIESLDGNDIKMEQLIDCCNTYPFIAQKRLVLVKNFDKLLPTRISKKNAEESPFTKYLNQPQETTFLIIISQYNELNGLSEQIKKLKTNDNISKKLQTLKYPYNILLSKFEWIEFPKIYESQLSQWIAYRVKNLGKNIDKEAIEFLVNSTNTNLRDINNEIEKLIIYTQERNNINIDDVRFVVGASRVYNIFELQKAISKRNLKDALIILQNMLNAEKQQMLIMTMLVRYFTVLWKLVEEIEKVKNPYQLATAIGVNHYFLNDYKSALNNYSNQELDRAFKYLCETDELLKSTSTDVLYLMQNMLIKIMDKNSQ